MFLVLGVSLSFVVFLVLLAGVGSTICVYRNKKKKKNYQVADDEENRVGGVGNSTASNGGKNGHEVRNKGELTNSVAQNGIEKSKLEHGIVGNGAGINGGAQNGTGINDGVQNGVENDEIDGGEGNGNEYGETDGGIQNQAERDGKVRVVEKVEIHDRGQNGNQNDVNGRVQDGVENNDEQDGNQNRAEDKEREVDSEVRNEPLSVTTSNGQAIIKVSANGMTTEIEICGRVTKNMYNSPHVDRVTKSSVLSGSGSAPPHRRGNTDQEDSEYVEGTFGMNKQRPNRARYQSQSHNDVDEIGQIRQKQQEMERQLQDTRKWLIQIKSG